MSTACRLLSMTQEHGRVEPISGSLDYSRYPLGSLLTLIPYHVSNVISELCSHLHQFYCFALFLSLPHPLSLYFCSPVPQRWCILCTMCTQRVVWWGSGHPHGGGELMFIMYDFMRVTEKTLEETTTTLQQHLLPTDNALLASRNTSVNLRAVCTSIHGTLMTPTAHNKNCSRSSSSVLERQATTPLK